MSSDDTPTMTRHADGSITAEWPDPPRPHYEVAHGVLVRYVEDMNELNRLRRTVAMIHELLTDNPRGWVASDTVSHILDN